MGPSVELDARYPAQELHKFELVKGRKIAEVANKLFG
jgi:hypothetical protein